MSYTPSPAFSALEETVFDELVANLSSRHGSDFTPGAAGNLGYKSLDATARAIAAGISSEHGWDDVRFPLSVARTGNTAPLFLEFRNGLHLPNIPHEGPERLLYYTCQLPHRYLAGTHLCPHIHFSFGDPKTDLTGADVAFELMVSAASVDNPFPAPKTITCTAEVSPVLYQHQVAIPDAYIDGEELGLTESACLIMRLRRLNDIPKHAEAGVFLVDGDLHFYAHKLGTVTPLPPYEGT